MLKKIISRLVSRYALTQEVYSSFKEFISHFALGSKTRQYPKLTQIIQKPRRPISFIVVKFSDDYLHNIIKSECIDQSINELITVDNTGNLYFDNLTEAIAAGISKSSNELIAVVHEDVLLPDGWQSWFEISLEVLETHDPNWGVLGSVGWTDSNKIFGHWSDPTNGYVNSFGKNKFKEVVKLDEQLLIFNRSRLIPLDINLPSIHHIGLDLPLTAQRNGMKTYAIDAPTIHKYADQNGKIILTRKDSPKITARKTYDYKADRAICNEYIMYKWPQIEIGDYRQPVLTLPDKNADLKHILDKPVILIGRGGSGTRLLSTLCQDLGLFLGNKLNCSGDSLEMVMPIYQSIIEKYRSKTQWQRQHIIQRLRCEAANMLIKNRRLNRTWGFKLPESILLLPELRTAFPNARFLHIVRDPLTCCLRRTHLTARLDNYIGRISLPIAYDYVGRPRQQILVDSPALHMAYTTIHQLDIVTSHLSEMNHDQNLHIRLEDILKEPTTCVESVSHWLNETRKKNRLELSIDHERHKKSKVRYKPEVEKQVESILNLTRLRYEYIEDFRHK